MCIKPIESLARSALYPRRQSLLSSGWTIYNSPVCDLPRINKLLPHKIHSMQGMMHCNVNRGVLTPRKTVLGDNRPNTLQHKPSFEHLSFWPINAAWGSRFRPRELLHPPRTGWCADSANRYTMCFNFYLTLYSCKYLHFGEVCQFLTSTKYGTYLWERPHRPFT